MRKVKTGIPGLDPLVGGGIPMDSVVLVSGAAGTGKTILALQFLAEGCRKHKERGLYISFEEREEKIREQASQFGWDLEGLEKDGMLRILSISRLSLGQIFDEMQKVLETFKPNRLVVDSITYMVLSARMRSRVVDLEKTPVDELIYGSGNAPITTPPEWDGIVVRKIMVDLVKLLGQKGICTLLVSEVSRSSEWYSRDTLSEFACDGIVLMKATSIGEDTQRTLEVVKMRNSRIKGGIYGFDFGEDGISISNP
ncbi:MAG: ATPase domain-containing protein [Candidatus Micrarchaeota archaeon]